MFTNKDNEKVKWKIRQCLCYFKFCNVMVCTSTSMKHCLSKQVDFNLNLELLLYFWEIFWAKITVCAFWQKRRLTVVIQNKRRDAHWEQYTEIVILLETKLCNARYSKKYSSKSQKEERTKILSNCSWHLRANVTCN
jgi:hypothetical protein